MKDGWNLERISDVCEVIAGQSPKGEFYNKEGIGLPFYQGKKDFTDKYLGEPSTWTTFVTKEAQEGDILMSVRAPVGPVNFATEKVCIGRGLASIRASSLVDKEFLFYFLKYREKDITGNAGAVFNSINKSQIENIEFPLPRLPEQQCIVALLDKAFTAIETAQKNTEKNLQNARELFESYLENIFSIQSNDWKKGVLNEVCLINPPKNLARRKLANDDFVSFVPMSDLGINQKFFTAQKSRKFEEVIKNYTYFENDDVLLAKITPCFENGKLGIANKLINNIGFGSSEYIVFRPKQFINNEFLYYFLSRKYFRQEGSGMMFGAVGHKRVAKEFIENYIISFPKMSLQKEIVDKIDIFSYKTNETIKIFQEKLRNLEDLKQSILQKAFVGEL